MRASSRFTRSVFLLLVGGALVLAGCSDTDPPEQPANTDGPEPTADAVVDDPEPEQEADDDEVQAAADGERVIENWEVSGNVDLEVGANPGTMAFVHRGSVLLRSGSSAVNVVDQDTGTAYTVGALSAGGAPLQGYYTPLAVFDAQVLYHYTGTTEKSKLAFVAIDGSGEPVTQDVLQDAAYLRDEDTVLSQDEASGTVVFAVDDGEGFSLHEFGADGQVGALAVVEQVPAHDVPTVTYHLGAAGGAYWFALVEEQDIYIGTEDYLGLYRMDLDTGAVESVDLGIQMTTRHNLHDLGELGVAITGPAELIYVPAEGGPRELPSILLEEYPDADRDLFDSVRGSGDELLVAGYQSVELHSLSTGGSTVISGTCGMLDHDFDSLCAFGHTFFGPGTGVTSVYSNAVYTYQRP